MLLVLLTGNVALVERFSGHGGAHALAAARQHGVSVMFTLSGGHVFPLYDAAVKTDTPMRILDVRHEQTAVFAAEATARLTRTAGLAVVTAGPGVTNSVSAVTTAWFNGAPVVVLAGRAPDYRWGAGSLQEMDHPPLLVPVTKRAWTEHDTARVAGSVDEAFRLAMSAHRGPVFLDISLEALYGQAEADLPSGQPLPVLAPDTADVDRIAGLLREARRPVLVLGSDVWLGGAEEAARSFAEALRLPVIANGQARGVLPRGHELLATRARSVALRQADLVIVAGTPLDFRLGYGSFGPEEAPARVVHVADSPAGIATHVPLAASAAGDLAAFFTALASCGAPGCDPGWVPGLAEAVRAALAADGPLLASSADPVHPARIYGELLKVLDDDAVVIGDGGDFVSVRRQVRRAGPAGKLARPRTVRLPGHRARLRDRGPGRPPVRSGRLAARRRGGRLLADGRRHPGPARAARGHRLREQRRLGPGTASHALPLRLRCRRRPAAGLPLRRGGARPRRGRGTRDRTRRHRPRAAPRL